MKQLQVGVHGKRYSSIVCSNSASVVDNIPRYFAFSWSGLRIGSRHQDKIFLSKCRKCIKYRLLSWRQTFGGTFRLCHQPEVDFQNFQKSLLLRPGRELAPLSLLNKSQNYCSTLSTTLLRYQQLVMNFQPSDKTDVCWPLPPFCFPTWKVHWLVQCAPLRHL